MPPSLPEESRAVIRANDADRVILGMEDARRSLSTWPPQWREALSMVEVAHAELTALRHELLVEVES
jgi:hypothetical protein